ncbi:VOC family protein [Planosporangium sp. 12N6]|uniref:VOC family protein n=1 Tax=Planosporangium spinosum TaxID=3402278 RepID=UPI003CF4A933
MTIASFKDLCMDAEDALSQARFWASVLGASPVDRGDGSARLDPASGRSSGEAIWIDPVPEPRTVKTRVHLDLRLAGASPEALLRAGATVVREPGRDPWWVLADPEGNEFCAFPPGPAASDPPGVFELVVDCRDAWAQATWWAEVTGGKARRSDEGPFAWVEGATGFPWRSWVFAEVPEPKVVKNRMHWDVDLVGSGPDALVAAGAAVLRERGGDIRWWVLADPEGNEFCAFPAGDR